MGRLADLWVVSCFTANVFSKSNMNYITLLRGHP